jgi:Ras-related protein Rab-11A
VKEKSGELLHSHMQPSFLFFEVRMRSVSRSKYGLWLVVAWICTQPAIIVAAADDYDFLYKVILIGDSDVGKSNLLSRYTRNEFLVGSKSTIGVEFATKTYPYEQKKIKIQVWDTAGQERFRAITSAYYRGSVGCIIVFDLTKRATFEHVDHWIEERKNFGGDDVIPILIGNKADLRHLRAVTREDAQAKAQEHGMAYIETSAYDGSNVEEAFVGLIETIYQARQSKTIYQVQQSKTIYQVQQNKEILLPSPPQPRESCCSE